jgi:hypothetical protein
MNRGCLCLWNCVKGKRNNCEKSKLESSFFQMIGMRACACVRLWNGVTSSRPVQNRTSALPNAYYYYTHTHTHTHCVCMVPCLFLKRISSLNRKCCFGPVSFSLSWDSKLILEHCLDDRTRSVLAWESVGMRCDIIGRLLLPQTTIYILPWCHIFSHTHQIIISG